MAVSWAEGVHGTFSEAETHLQAELEDPVTRAPATVALASRLATALAGDDAVFPGTSDLGTCPGRYAAQATSVIAALPAAQAGSTVANAATRLHDVGWTIDPASASDRRFAVRAHNRRGIVVTVSRVAGNDATAIDVVVTVPCSALGATSEAPATTTTGA